MSNDGYAWKAVDGNYNTKFSGGSCTHTGQQTEKYAWWQVDLLQMSWIYKVSDTFASMLSYIVDSRKLNLVAI